MTNKMHIEYCIGVFPRLLLMSIMFLPGFTSNCGPGLKGQIRNLPGNFSMTAGASVKITAYLCSPY